MRRLHSLFLFNERQNERNDDENQEHCSEYEEQRIARIWGTSIHEMKRTGWVTVW